MKKETIRTSEAPEAIGPYTQGQIFGDLVFTSGQIALDLNGEVVQGDIKVQTAKVLDNLIAVLDAADANLSSVIKTTCFLTDMSDFDAFNEVYGEYFVGSRPARSCVEVSALPKGVKVEIEVLAYRTLKDAEDYL